MANVLYIEAPVGVGFSYSDSQSYHLNDDRTADENRAAMENFFSMYPELKSNKLFITGESYAGIYVPTLAEAILNGEADGSYTGAKLSGIAVGNGCTGTEIGICGDGSQGTFYEWTYLLETGFISEDLKHRVNSACDWEAAAENSPDALTTECVLLLSEASKQIGHVDMYNIYGDCVSGGCARDSQPVRGKIPLMRTAVPGVEQHGRMLGRITPHGPDACIDSIAASAYLNDPSVMEAIHVRDPGFCWSVCGTVSGWTYQSTRTNLPKNTYPQLVSNIDVLIYNGTIQCVYAFLIILFIFYFLKVIGMLVFHTRTMKRGPKIWDTRSPRRGMHGRTLQHMVTIIKSPAMLLLMMSPNLVLEASRLLQSVEVCIFSFRWEIILKFTSDHRFRPGRHEVPETAPVQAMSMLSKLINGESF